MGGGVTKLKVNTKKKSVADSRKLDGEKAEAERSTAAPLERLLEETARQGKIEEVVAMLEKSPELLTASLNEDGMRVLHVAAANGHEELVKVLLSRGAVLDEKNSKGATALMFAAAGGFENLCKIILDAGADVRIEDASSQNALSYAQLHNQTKTEKLLQMYACEYTW